jgi:hypothetical protein
MYSLREGSPSRDDLSLQRPASRLSRYNHRATTVVYQRIFLKQKRIPKGEEMTTEPQSTKQERPKSKVIYHRGATSEAVYGLGLIGAWVYYLSHAATFWLGALGILKGIVWPAMLVFEALKYLHM